MNNVIPNNDESKLKIFLVAHKKIENFIPKDKRYVIIAQTKDVDNSYNDNFHDIIDISDDTFTKNHNVCWGEGNSMRYLYNHPELIPDYICFGHYRRYFSEFIGHENDMINIIDSGKVIVPKPLNHDISLMHTKYEHHPDKDVNIFNNAVEKMIPEYFDTYKTFYTTKIQYSFNCFAMKKENFLEMCEMCLKVLDYFDDIQNYHNNKDVEQRILSYQNWQNAPFGFGWQIRLQGFFLELLTDLYRRQKFNESNFYIS